MEFRIKQTSDTEFISEVWVHHPDEWFMIEKHGNTCYPIDIHRQDQKFCICDGLEQAQAAIKQFKAHPKFPHYKYPIYHNFLN